MRQPRKSSPSSFDLQTETITVVSVINRMIVGFFASTPFRQTTTGGSVIIIPTPTSPARHYERRNGRICSWGIPLAECYGVRLPCDYCGEVPKGMVLMDVPRGEYLVFEHGPFDYETQNVAVEAKIEKAMAEFDYPASGYELDLTEGRLFYFFHDTERYWKYIRPVKKSR